MVVLYRWSFGVIFQGINKQTSNMLIPIEGFVGFVGSQSPDLRIKKTNFLFILQRLCQIWTCHTPWSSSCDAEDWDGWTTQKHNARLHLKRLASSSADRIADTTQGFKAEQRCWHKPLKEWNVCSCHRPESPAAGTLWGTLREAEHWSGVLQLDWWACDGTFQRKMNFQVTYETLV